MRKDYSDKERRKVLLNLLAIVDVIGLDKVKIINALKKADFRDYEDCLQAECAEDCSADYIVTRNTRDFSNAEIKAITPSEYLAIINSFQ